MPTAKFTIAEGQPAHQVVQAAGSAIAGGNAIEVNIDSTKITQGEAVAMLEKTKQRVAQGKWPLA